VHPQDTAVTAGSDVQRYAIRVAPQYTGNDADTFRCYVGGDYRGRYGVIISNKRSSLIDPHPTAQNQVVTKLVRSVPARPQLTTIGQRPGVVRVPTIQLQLTRPPEGRFE
jgi:hypothetical protein